jgi:Domain of unknown function (DUF4340)
MSRQRFLALLVTAALAIFGAMYLSTQRNLQRDAHGGLLLPTLSNELSTVTALSVRRGSPTPTVTVHQESGRWTVAERADYPADVTKLRKLLLALSDAKIVEEKTSTPANFSLIGVDDPAAAGASGAEISVTAKDGKHVVIIGKSIGAGNFARRGGENTSYSVEPGISFETEPRFWIESKLLEIPVSSIQSIQVKPSSGAAYSVSREAVPVAAAPAAPAAAVKAGTAATTGTAGTTGAPAAAANTAASAAAPSSSAGGNFTLDGVPPGRKAADSAALAPSSTAFSGLSADDVAPASGIDFSKATVATLTLIDGNVITLTGTALADKHWIQVQSSKDAPLNAKTAGRAFEIASYRFDAVFRPLEQLLVPKPPPPAAKPPAANKATPTKKPVPAPAS